MANQVGWHGPEACVIPGGLVFERKTIFKLVGSRLEAELGQYSTLFGNQL